MNKPVCPVCGHEMVEGRFPRYLFRWRIPFTFIDIEVVHWQKEYYCPWCLGEEENAKIDRIVQGAEDYAYRQGWEDGYGARG